MARIFISKDYPSPLCYAVPLLIHALCAQRNWRPCDLAEAADISLREAWYLTTPGRRLSLDMLERVANAFDLTPAEFLKLAEGVPLPADRSLTVCPSPVALVLPALPKWAVRQA
ncbi:MAG: hypothetical protein HY301_09315 [Verrucomicrobia bacterium]|nr:hypothetical protein [Verrucomicrobiota bacterium]